MAQDQIPAPVTADAGSGGGRNVLRSLRRNRLALVAFGYIGLFIVVAVLGDAITPLDPTETAVPNALSSPSWDHLLGTDELGRDVLSRVISGARVSLQVGLVAVGIAVSLGVPAGLIAGFHGRWLDATLMRITDMLFAFPAILLAIAILAVRGPGIENAMVALGIVYTPIFARIARGSVLTVRSMDYVRAARSMGAPNWRIIVHHILPNSIAPIIVQISLSFAFAVLAEAALSFLGIGVQPPAPAWGVMLSEGRSFVHLAPWMGIAPGVAILLTVLSFNIVGDALRDALDPRSNTERV